jgi:ATP-dependent RNA helicase DDX47/RRP3
MDRELAIQIAEQFNALGAPIHVKVEVVIGGKGSFVLPEDFSCQRVDLLAQRLALTNRPHIVIATLGRLLDHLNTGANIDFSRLKYLVLDEADRLLTNDGLRKTLDGFLESVPLNRCQKLLFSATMNITDNDMSSLQLREPVKCSVGLM